MNEHTSRTQDREIASRGLQGVREAAQRDKGLRFTTLLHHVNEKLLLELLSAEETSCTGGGSSDMGRVPGTAIEASLHPETGRAAASVGNRGGGRQNRATGCGGSSESDI
jgi:hypothetical protein